MAADPSRYERTRCYRRTWLFERIGWGAMGAAILGAVLGLFGNGLLGDVEAAADGSTVRYPRFVRVRAPLEVAVEWVPGGAEATLSIDRRYLDELRIEEIRPAPARVTADPRRIHYTFPLREPRTRAVVRLLLEPEHGGVLGGSIGFGDGREIEVRQFAFP